MHGACQTIPELKETRLTRSAPGQSVVLLVQATVWFPTYGPWFGLPFSYMMSDVVLKRGTERVVVDSSQVTSEILKRTFRVRKESFYID